MKDTKMLDVSSGEPIQVICLFAVRFSPCFFPTRYISQAPSATGFLLGWLMGGIEWVGDRAERRSQSIYHPLSLCFRPHGVMSPLWFQFLTTTFSLDPLLLVALGS